MQCKEGQHVVFDRIWFESTYHLAIIIFQNCLVWRLNFLPAIFNQSIMPHIKNTLVINVCAKLIKD